MNGMGTVRFLSVSVGMAWIAAFAAAGTVAVGDITDNRVIMVDGISGVFRGTIASGGGLVRPFGFAYGPDGFLYVSSNGTHQIKRYNSLGVFVDNFISTPRPHGLTFFERDLVVANAQNGTITRHGTVSWTSQPRAGRIYQAVVVRNGRLFAGFNTSGTSQGGIEEFDPASGSSMGDFVPISRGLRDVQGFNWGPDGTLYVTSSNSNRIFRFNDAGQMLGSFDTPGQPLGLRFNANGELLSTVWAQRQVARMGVPSFSHLGGLLPATVTTTQPWYIELVNPTIEGQLIFNDRVAGSLPAATATFEFSWPGSPVTLQSRTATLQSDGRFTVLAPSFLTEYDIRVKIGAFLQRTVRIDTRDVRRSRPVFELVNGDVDGSNTIDSVDYRLLAQAMGRASGQSGFDARADLNGDGSVNSLDAVIFSRNFGLSGRGQ